MSMFIGVNKVKQKFPEDDDALKEPNPALRELKIRQRFKQMGLLDNVSNMMTDEILKGFATKYIGNPPRDNINTVQINSIKDTGKKLSKIKIFDCGIIASRYGKRIIITGEGTYFNSISQDNVLEIVDYDPSRRFLLALGHTSCSPPNETPIIWHALYNIPDIEAAIMIHYDNIQDINKVNNEENIVDIKILDLNNLLNTLGILKNNNYILLENKGVLAIGKNLDEAYNLIKKIFEDIIDKESKD